MPANSLAIKPLLVDLPAAAGALSVSKRTVCNLVSRGELRPIKIGTALRFSIRDLRAFVARHQHKPTNQKPSPRC